MILSKIVEQLMHFYCVDFLNTQDPDQLVFIVDGERVSFETEDI